MGEQNMRSFQVLLLNQHEAKPVGNYQNYHVSIWFHLPNQLGINLLVHSKFRPKFVLRAQKVLQLDKANLNPMAYKENIPPTILVS